VRQWEAGHDVVYGVLRRRQGDSWWKAGAARLVYRLINRLADVEITPDATDFRLLSRRALDALNQFDERNRYLRGFAHWIGFPRCAVVYDRRPRTAGQSKASFLYLLGFVANALTCLSVRPVQLYSLAGGLVLAMTVGLALAHGIGCLLGGGLPGLTGLHLLLLANLGVMLVGFGTLGEYAGRAYFEAKRRPLYLIERTINLDAAVPVPTFRENTNGVKHASL